MLENLWVMRHGLAESQFESDYTRPLSLEGQQQVKNTIDQLLIEPDCLPENMLVSPLARTQATAKIAHRLLALKTPLKTEKMLVHSADHRLLGDFLMASEYKNLMIVSHMPIVAYLCQYLMPQSDLFGFETAQIAHISFEGPANRARLNQIFRSKV